MKNTIKKIKDIIQGYRKIQHLPFRYRVFLYLYFPRLLCRTKSYNFESVQTMVLTIGFARSGSSLIGYLLTAHPNIIMPDEPSIDFPYDPALIPVDLHIRPDGRYLYEADLNEVFNYLAHVEQWRYILGASIMCRNESRNSVLRGHLRVKRYILIPKHSQGRFESLKVVGVKESHQNTDILTRGDILRNLKRKLKERKISLKFIFTIRNPEDMIATNLREEVGTRRNSKDITKYIERMAELCKQNKELLQQIDPDDVFISRNEDIISHPKKQFSKLCDFLQVDASTNYLDACASRVIAKPTRSRLEIDWSQEHKRKIASLIEDYDFFRGYDV